MERIEKDTVLIVTSEFSLSVHRAESGFVFAFYKRGEDKPYSVSVESSRRATQRRLKQIVLSGVESVWGDESLYDKANAYRRDLTPEE